VDLSPQVMPERIDSAGRSWWQREITVFTGAGLSATEEAAH